MAEESDVWKGPAIVWKTEKATGDRSRASSLFSLLGATWRLEMHENPFVSFFVIKNVCCRVSLNRIGNDKPNAQFSVVTSIQSIKDGLKFRSTGFEKAITEDVTTLWKCDVDDASKEISDFKESAEVTVICVITDISSTTSDCLNETVKLKSETDFDCQLPFKELHDVKMSSDANLDSLSLDLGTLLEDKLIPDINLKCGDRTVAAHKAILAARSPVFSAMFQSKMLESETGVVDITDVDADVLEMFLKYVYSGRLSDLSAETLPSLYAAGDKYDVSALKRACSERMINSLSSENCLNILLLTDTHNDKDFKKAVKDFILNHMEILKSQKWKTFSKKHSVLAVEVFQTVVQDKYFS